MSEPTKEQIDKGALSRQRAEFEAWYSPKFAGGSVANMPLNPSSGEYKQVQHEIAWRAWECASTNTPTWKDEPDVSGRWLYYSGWGGAVVVVVSIGMLPDSLNHKIYGRRYYGPIPEYEK